MPLQGAIDVDRGVTIRQIVKFDEKNRDKFEGDPQFGGLTVIMYKDAPGTYFDVQGRPVPEKIAEKAGFPVAKLAKARKHREKLAELDQMLRLELNLENEEEIVMAEAGDYKVIALPMDRAKIVDKETGATVTPVPMPRSDALMLFKSLTADLPEAPTPVSATVSIKEKANGRSSS